MSPAPAPPAESGRAAAAPRRRRRLLWPLLALLLLLAALLLLRLVLDEANSSRRQAQRLSALAAELHYGPQPGASADIRFPGDGPYDQRLGYHALPAMLERLGSADWQLTSQSRWSPRLLELVDRGLFTPYAEKNQAGLALLDCRGETLFAARVPQRVFGRFDAVPQMVVDALLFIENRQLLDAGKPMLNPAVDWGRLASAVFDQVRGWVDPGHPAPGGSTLATQIEKYRHSPGGRTDSAHEKLRQMLSASLRAYPDGELNLPRRRQIVVDYLDTVPLAARLGFGEVHGLGDAMWAWYGRDLDEVRQLLTTPPPGDGNGAGGPAAAPLAQRALAFKQLLSLLVAQRRPGHYLGRPGAETGLLALTDSHLRLLAQAGIIPAALRDAALPLALAPSALAPPPPEIDFSQRKAVTALRSRLSGLLDQPSAYALDRLDLQASSTLDGGLQRAVAALLGGLGERGGAQAAGLIGNQLLRESDDPSPLRFSFTLYERAAGANLLRVQTDNLDQPFDINEGARLDLGSTAKLRTLISYLELVAGLHARWGALDGVQLAVLQVDRADSLGRWAREHLMRAADRGLPAMLDAAMARSFSASPAEAYFTGGGLHRFENFDAADNHRVMSVREALTRSVNLVFIRLMREQVQHLLLALPAAATLDAADDDPARLAMLARFADREGRVFLARFHAEFRGLSPDQIEARLLAGHRATPARLAALFGELEPDAGAVALAAFIARHLPDADPGEGTLAGLQLRYGGGQMSLSDRAYVAGVHPLALWLAGQLRRQPQATLDQAVAASAEQRQAVYGWLLRTRHRSAQDRRIRSLLEIDVFAELQRRWHRLGYPFENLTPSYATALGASGDRPAALAELMGIIVNGGQRQPVRRFSSLAFARDTPYESWLAPPDATPERLLDPALAAVLRGALIGVVEDGTARRLKGVFVDAGGKPLAVGGKTGTGDHRNEVIGRDGRLLATRVINRTATLVFLIGDRHWGTVMAYVHEPDAERYRFTSALPAQLLVALAPLLQPLLLADGCR